MQRLTCLLRNFSRPQGQLKSLSSILHLYLLNAGVLTGAPGPFRVIQVNLGNDSVWIMVLGFTTLTVTRLRLLVHLGHTFFDRETRGLAFCTTDWMVESDAFIAPSKHGPAVMSRDVEHVTCEAGYTGIECLGFTAFGVNRQETYRSNFAYLNRETWFDRAGTWLTPPRRGWKSEIDAITANIFNQLLTRDFNSKFEMITTFADLDATVKMITDKFPLAAKLTRKRALPDPRQVPAGESRDRLIQKYRDIHAEAMWGWIPFIGDLPKIKDAIEGQFRNVEKYRSDEVKHSYSTSLNRDYSTRWARDEESNFIKSMSGKARASGYITQGGPLVGNQSARDLLSALDMLGVHPDLKTAWDIVPMSFVADYFLPIGDALGSLKPRGWTTPHLSFTGWLTVKADLKCTYSDGYQSVQRNTLGCSVHHYYSRKFVNMIPVRHFAEPEKPWNESLATPSITNLFHTLVLSKAVKQKYG